MGTPCSLKWREAGERERIWVINRGHRIAEGLGECVEIAQHGNVWRAVRRAGAAGDGVRVLVRGRRGVPLRPHLPARRRPHLLFPAGPRDLSDLPPCRCPQDAAQRRALGAQSGAGRGRRSPTRRTCRSARPRRRSSRRARGCTPTATSRAEVGDAEAAAARHRRHRRPPHRRVRGDPGMQDRRLRRPRARPRRDVCAEATASAAHFERLDAALAWGKFDAAINCTPDGVHMATTLALLAAGKHVFCEKPLAPNHADALAMTEAAGSARPRQHGQPHLPQLAGAAAGARHGRGRRRSARCAMSRRATARAGWSARRGATGGSRTNGCGGCRPGTARPACSATSASTSSTSRPMARPTRSCSVQGDLATFPKAEGDRIGDYLLDANDSVAVTARLAIRRAGDDRGDALRHRPRQRSDAVAARHQGRAARRDRRQGVAACQAASARTSTSNRWKKIERRPVQAQRPAFCRCADERQERRSVLPPRRRHPARDRRGFRERQIGQAGCGRLVPSSRPFDAANGEKASLLAIRPLRVRSIAYCAIR